MFDNIGQLAQPATTLIEKVSNAVGILYQPTQVRRMAKAEVDAEKIRVVGGMELTEIQQRGLDRLIHQEARKQSNMEQITAQAVGLLPSDAEVQRLDEDWVAHFFKQCDTVSDKEMQFLWARLLSGEATRPGTFSKRTINVVSSLNKKDASLFTALCSFNWTIDSGSPIFGPLIYDISVGIYDVYDITYNALLELETIGLINFDSSGYKLVNFETKAIECRYFEKTVAIEFEQVSPHNTLIAGIVSLTAAGSELAPISGCKPDTRIFDDVVSRWIGQGLNVILPR